jgi:hypothetical protein
MEKPSLKITYDAFQNNFGVEDFRNIEDFKRKISKEYSSFVKPNPVGRGGPAYQFIIDFFIDKTLEDYLKYIGEYIVGKAVDKVTDPIIDRYLFHPLKKAYDDLRAKNPLLDCYSFNIEFLNTKLFIYSVSENSIMENKDKILKCLDTHFKKLVSTEGEFPTEIHIPVYDEIIDGKLIYRPPLGVEQTIDTAKDNKLLKLWGLKYFFTYRSVVYDVVNERIIEDVEFMTEREFYHYKRENDN